MKNILKVGRRTKSKAVLKVNRSHLPKINKKNDFKNFISTAIDIYIFISTPLIECLGLIGILYISAGKHVLMRLTLATATFAGFLKYFIFFITLFI